MPDLATNNEARGVEFIPAMRDDALSQQATVSQSRKI